MKELKEKATYLLLGLLIGSVYVIKKKDEKIQGLKNENLNARDLCKGQEDTIRALCYGLGKLKNKNKIWKR